MVLEVQRYPSKNELSWFGLIMLACFGAFGGFVYWSFGNLPFAGTLWTVGVVLCAIFYVIRPLRIVFYRAWMRLFYPLGWFVSRTLFAAVYFLVITPMGVAIRLIGYDPLNKKKINGVDSYWRERQKVMPILRYFRQF